ncbi:uncharacterized protein LOC144435913 [Glandiceps talaboti]
MMGNWNMACETGYFSNGLGNCSPCSLCKKLSRQPRGCEECNEISTTGLLLVSSSTTDNSTPRVGRPITGTPPTTTTTDGATEAVQHETVFQGVINWCFPCLPLTLAVVIFVIILCATIIGIICYKCGKKDRRRYYAIERCEEAVRVGHGLQKQNYYQYNPMAQMTDAYIWNLAETPACTERFEPGKTKESKVPPLSVASAVTNVDNGSEVRHDQTSVNPQDGEKSSCCVKVSRDGDRGPCKTLPSGRNNLSCSRGQHRSELRDREGLTETSV